MFAEDDPDNKDKDNPDIQDNPKDKDDNSSKDKDKDGSKGKDKDNTPDIQQMMNDYAKLKRAFDKTSSELAETKKALKEKMTEQEIASQEKAEAEAEKEEHYKQIERENKIYKIKATYLGLGYTSDEAQRIAEAEADNDFDEKTKIMSEVEARKKKEMEAEFLANRPEINTGNGSDVLTKEKFDQMDMVEKSKLRRDDPETYEKFIGRK
jgi:hypothetical protein